MARWTQSSIGAFRAEEERRREDDLSMRRITESRLLEALKGEESDLHPALPVNLPRLEDWLGRAAVVAEGEGETARLVRRLAEDDSPRNHWFREALEAHELALSEFLDERRVVTAGTWKFFVRGNLTHSMFDLAADPGERNQLDVNDHPIAGRFLRTMQGQFLGSADRSNWLAAEQTARQRLESGDAQMDDELQQQLRELGYLN